MDLTQEKRLIKRAQSDSEAFGELFDYYYPKIMNYCVRRVGDVALAQDLASIVMVKAYKKLWQFKWQGVAFGAWLYRIASNEIKTYYRQQKISQASLEELKDLTGFEPRDLTDIEGELVAAEEELARHQQFLEVRGLIEKLDIKYQEVIHLRFFEDKKVAEIGVILGKKPGTVKSLVSRGLKQLRQAVLVSKLGKNEAGKVPMEQKAQPMGEKSVKNLEGQRVFYDER